jgi:hypothetical protein
MRAMRPDDQDDRRGSRCVSAARAGAGLCQLIGHLSRAPQSVIELTETGLFETTIDPIGGYLHAIFDGVW